MVDPATRAVTTDCLFLVSLPTNKLVKVKVGVLCPVRQPGGGGGGYWERSSALSLMGLEPTEVTAYD